jgi:hypothetical protein
MCIYNFCFADDFVTRVPLDKWGYSKSGKTYGAVAEGLTVTNPDFKREMQSMTFNNWATVNVVNDVFELCPTINDYNEKKLKMGNWDNPQYRSLYGFMREYVAQAIIDSDKGAIGTAMPGLVFKAVCNNGNDVHKIADFFVYHSYLDCNDQALIITNHKNLTESGKLGAEKYINDTHNMGTYIAALKNNGFCTLYLYREQN